jgi:hypothetical protein
MEIDIIKFYLFTKKQRKLISILSSPDFSVNQEEMYERIKHQYRRFDLENFENKVDLILRDSLNEARHDNNFNKLIQIVQNGNKIVLDY